MTNTEIIDMAKEAGMYEPDTPGVLHTGVYELVKFVNAIQAEKCEHCASYMEGYEAAKHEIRDACHAEIEELKAELAKDEPAPVAWMDCFGNISRTKYRGFTTPLFAAPGAKGTHNLRTLFVVDFWPATHIVSSNLDFKYLIPDFKSRIARFCRLKINVAEFFQLVDELPHEQNY